MMRDVMLSACSGVGHWGYSSFLPPPPFGVGRVAGVLVSVRPKFRVYVSRGVHRPFFTLCDGFGLSYEQAYTDY
jgi:hypothetical protein